MSLFQKPPVGYVGGEMLTIVGPEALFHGSMTVRGSLRVEGELEGNVAEAQEVVVGAHGRIRGNVCAERAEIGGEVRGDVVCSVHLEVKSGGKVFGNIRSPRILIEDGAFFEGQCAMSDSSSAPAVAQA